MNCPQCGSKLKVIASRVNPEGNTTVRSLFCEECLEHFYTNEQFSTRNDYRRVAGPKELEYRMRNKAGANEKV